MLHGVETGSGTFAAVIVVVVVVGFDPAGASFRLSSCHVLFV